MVFLMRLMYFRDILQLAWGHFSVCTNTVPVPLVTVTVLSANMFTISIVHLSGANAMNINKRYTFSMLSVFGLSLSIHLTLFRFLTEGSFSIHKFSGTFLLASHLLFVFFLKYFPYLKFIVLL